MVAQRWMSARLGATTIVCFSSPAASPFVPFNHVLHGTLWFEGQSTDPGRWFFLGSSHDCWHTLMTTSQRQLHFRRGSDSFKHDNSTSSMAKRVAPAVLSVILVDTEFSTVSEKPLGQGPCAIRLGGSKIARRERINDVLAKFVIDKSPIVERHFEVCEVDS